MASYRTPPAETMSLEDLNDYLSSDRAPPECMLLSDLDGFLTGIAAGPEIIPPSEWLPVVWGGEEPQFDDEGHAQAVLRVITNRYNAIVRGIDEKAVEPVFWHSEDTVVGADWAYGFAQAILLREKTWEKMMRSEAGMMMFPIMLLYEGEELFDELDVDPGEERPSVEDVIDMLPGCVISIAEYWRMSPSEREEFTVDLHAISKVGRNDLCPCGSGKKFQDCCGTIH
jgi:uncharacterized protein